MHSCRASLPGFARSHPSTRAAPSVRRGSSASATGGLGLWGAVTGLIGSLARGASARTMAYSEGPKWWDASSVAVVTGANKGIGLEIAKALRTQGMTVVLTARNEQLGNDAKAKVEALEGDGQVAFHQLDVTDAASIAAFAEWVKATHPGGIDVLVNNAGFAFKGNVFGATEAKATLDTNYYGTAAITRALVPCLRDKTGRVVTVSSRAGSTRIVPSQQLLATIKAANAPGLDALAKKFVDDIAAGTHEKNGWPNSMYGVSKLLLSMATRLQAKELQPRGIMVNACCPGWCQTDMSSQRGPNTAAQGADTPVWLALRNPDAFKTGCFFGERTELPF